jgi:hypothetical protein
MARTHLATIHKVHLIPEENSNHSKETQSPYFLPQHREGNGSIFTFPSSHNHCMMREKKKLPKTISLPANKIRVSDKWGGSALRVCRISRAHVEKPYHWMG